MSEKTSHVARIPRFRLFFVHVAFNFRGSLDRLNVPSRNRWRSAGFAMVLLITQSGEYCATMQKAIGLQLSSSFSPKKESQPAEGAGTPFRYVPGEPTALLPISTECVCTQHQQRIATFIPDHNKHNVYELLLSSSPQQTPLVCGHDNKLLYWNLTFKL